MSDNQDNETSQNNDWVHKYLIRSTSDDLPKYGYLDVPGQGHYVVCADPVRIVWFPTVHIPPSPEMIARREELLRQAKGEGIDRE